MSDEEAAHFLFHSPRGVKAAEHLANATAAKDKPKMSRSERLKSITKSLGSAEGRGRHQKEASSGGQ
jgi:hypothetical protein